MTANDTDNQIAFTRRKAIVGAATAGVALPLLAACGSSGASDNTGAGASTGGGTTSGGGGGTSLGAASAIPVGGGKIFNDQAVVVTQPTAGQYKGFSAVCTHEQCLVGTIVDGKIECPCHGSEYSITDGSVIQGPATRPLPPVNVTVSGGNITVS